MEILGLPGGQVPGMASPWGGLSAAGAWHILREPSPETLPAAAVQHPFKAGYHCGSCISRKDAVRGCGGALPGPTGAGQEPQPGGHDWAHAWGVGTKDASKQCLIPFFFSMTK